MKKILFLDVDGVLNSADWFQENHLAKIDARKNGESEINIILKHAYPMGHLSPILIEKLNVICEKTDCNIVISSTWRLHNPFEDLGIWLTKKGFRYSHKILDRTCNLNMSYGRGYEIQNWLNDHGDDVKSFAILDDDWDMHHLMPWLVQTDYIEGLTDEHVALAILILNNETETAPYHERRSFHAKHMTDSVWGKEEIRYGVSF